MSIHKVKKSDDKGLLLAVGGGYAMGKSDVNGILVVPDAGDMYGVMITDKELRELGYVPVVEKSEGDDKESVAT